MMEDSEFKDVGAGGLSRPPKAERQWAAGCHLIGLCGVVVPLPAAGLIGTLVLWLIKREDGAFIDSQGKEAVNFQISLLIYAVLCLFLVKIVIGFFMLGILVLFAFASVVIASIRASEGIPFRYPACIRFIQ